MDAEIALVRSRIAAATGKDVLLPSSESGTPLLSQANDPQGLSLASATQLLQKASEVLKGGLLDRIFWSRGEEVTSLHCIREADRLLVAKYSSEEVYIHLVALLQSLRRLTDPEAVAFAEKTEEALKKNPSDRELRAWLWEGMLYQGDAELGRVRDRLDHYNRTMWLTTTALLLIVVLGGIGGHPELFLAGAIGGLLGRLRRVLKENKEDTKGFGISSWGTFFLSPLVGALLGWTGVLMGLIASYGVADDAGISKAWTTSASVSMLALAVLLGLSEKYFDQLLGKVEEGTAEESGKMKPGGGRQPKTAQAT